MKKISKRPNREVRKKELKYGTYLIVNDTLTAKNKDKSLTAIAPRIETRVDKILPLDWKKSDKISVYTEKQAFKKYNIPFKNEEKELKAKIEKAHKETNLKRKLNELLKGNKKSASVSK